MEKKYYTVDTHGKDSHGGNVGCRYQISAVSRTEAKAEARLREMKKGHTLDCAPVVKYER